MKLQNLLVGFVFGAEMRTVCSRLVLILGAIRDETLLFPPWIDPRLPTFAGCV